MKRYLEGKRKALIAAGAAVFAFAVVAPTAGYLLSNSANASEESGAFAADPLAGLDGRSPGERLFGIATKAAKRAIGLEPDPMGDGDDPQQRALGQVFDDVPPTEAFTFAPPVNAPEFASLDPGGFVPSDTSPGGVGPGPGPGGNPGGGGGVPGGGGNPPVPGVPEPGTWALMILGFGAVGTAMRRRSRQMRLSAQA